MLARLTRILVLGMLATAVAAGATSAQDAKKQSSGVGGKWTLSVDTPHGAMVMEMTLKQEDTHVTGTFASPHGDMPVDGEFHEGSLKLSTTGNTDSQITFEAKLKDDDSLEGYLSSQMGDMKWTGKRLKDKQ